MKWKYVVFLLICAGTSLVGLVGIVKYYRFEWSVLTDLSFYESLANPSIRIVKIVPGLRKEQIAEIVGNKLGWDDAEKNEFMNPIPKKLLAQNTDESNTEMINYEGRYFPKSYMLNINADDPETISQIMFNTYDRETSKIKKSKNSQVISEDTALKIASIIQREAGGKHDMNLISGIIWNRIFAGMKLQMDATLQYAKGTEEIWWPRVKSEDKYIDSLYNTYLHKNLPPSPIANPGINAITAAYNPQKTKCMYYIHDKYSKIHCTVTYADHLKNIKKYY